MIVFEDWSDEAYPADWYNLYRSWKKPLLSNSGNLVSSNQHNLLNYSQQNYDDCFPKKNQLQRKKFLFLTENNVILIPFTNVHCNFTEVKTLESKWNWLYFLYLWSYI